MSILENLIGADREEQLKGDYLYVRHGLRDLVLAADDLERSVRPMGLNQKTKRLLLTVHSAPLADEVRQVMGKLLRLRDAMTELQINFQRNRGLWLPVVADEQAGDTQVNITVSDSWCTREVVVDDIAQMMEEPADSQAWIDLMMIGRRHEKLKICRNSGHHYRVAIRGERRGNPEGAAPHQGRDLCNFHEFVLVLGSLPVNLPQKRPRREKRSDAWRGVVPELFRFMDRRGGEWYVYPFSEC